MLEFANDYCAPATDAPAALADSQKHVPLNKAMACCSSEKHGGGISGYDSRTFSQKYQGEVSEDQAAAVTVPHDLNQDYGKDEVSSIREEQLLYYRGGGRS